MCATAALDRKSRLELRISSDQKSTIERAASLRGMTVTQWITSHLAEDARRDIEDASVTWLSARTFDEFSAALDAPLNDRARSTLAREPRWA